MSHSRRRFIKNAGIITVSTGVLGAKSAFAKNTEPLFPDGYPDRKEIIQTAIDSAVKAGATYADARLSHLESMGGISVERTNRIENMAFGVRALYEGYWGFASSPFWSMDEAARLGAAAVAQAKANVLGRDRITELAPNDDRTSGHWEMPVKIDPFKIHPDEISDYFEGIVAHLGTLKFYGTSSMGYKFDRINKAFGSSFGQFTTQTLYQTGGWIAFGLKEPSTGAETGIGVKELSYAGEGFEYFRGRPIREYIKVAHEEAMSDLSLPVKPVDVGRHKLLVDQLGVASLLHKSIGVATEIDRVFGYEANAGGTSYITEPETMLGTFKVGSPLMNVTADRSQVGSVGLVKWDDEGVAPSRHELVKDGLIVNLQTNLEGASWIKDYYQQINKPVRSFGCSYAPTALDVPLVHNADLYLKPDDSSHDLDKLRMEMEDGVEVASPGVELDFQQISGLMQEARTYEVRKGKRVARLSDAGVLFRTPELWTNMTHIGGAESVLYFGMVAQKGQPSQYSTSGVFSPPALFKEMTLIDVKRKA